MAKTQGEVSLQMWCVAEVVAICLCLLAAFLYRVRAHSWRLLIRQVVLLPLLVGYCGYLVSTRDDPNPFSLSHSFRRIVYQCLLFSVAHIVLFVALTDRRVLWWAAFGKPGAKPDIPRVKLTDVVFCVVLAAVGFAGCLAAYYTEVWLKGRSI